MITALIIDDEASARSFLSKLLTEHCPDLKLVGEAEDVPSAVKAIHKHDPDIIFLDVEMPGQDGFQLLDFFEEPAFQIIFTTAYMEYAIKAFEVAAIGYLTKPIQISKLKLAVANAVRMKSQSGKEEQLSLFKEVLKVDHIQKVALPLSDGIFFVALEDIVYLEAKGSYTSVITREQEVLISKRIKEFETILNEDVWFFRMHRSYIVNIKHIKKYVKHDGKYVILENNQVLPVARERLKDFELILDKVLVGRRS